MKKWKRSFISFLMCWVVGVTWAQNIPIGSWRSHFSYNDIHEIISGNGKIIASSNFGLFYVDPQSGAIETLSKQDGFSDVGVTSMAYDEAHETLIVGYESGLIDFFQNGKVTTVRDLNKSSLVGSKRINDIISFNGHAYAGTSFGILDIQLESRTLTNNFRSIGPSGEDAVVEEMIIHDGQLFAITNRGIQSGDLNQNLRDFNNWNRDPIQSSTFHSLIVSEDLVHCIINDNQLGQFINGEWVVLSSFTSPLQSLIAAGNDLFALTEKSLLQIEGTEFIEVETWEDSRNTAHYLNGFWYGHEAKGLEDPNGEMIIPNGPKKDQMTRTRLLNGQIYGFYGVWPFLYQGITDSLGYEVFDNSEWRHVPVEGFYNISDGAYFNSKLYFASIGYGLYDNEQQQPVEEIGNNQAGNGAIIPELAVDDKLYGISWLHENSLFMIDDENNVAQIADSEVTSSYPEALKISRGGTLWITNSDYEETDYDDNSIQPIINRSQIILLYPDENLFRDLSSSDGLPGQFINNLIIDGNDEVWIATNSGPVIFSEGTFIFDDNLRGVAPIYDNQLLFADENIHQVATDGGNRIWISTDDGLWIFNNSLTVLEEHFTTENSPLTSHIIHDMTYHTRTGEMYLLTEKGLVSYRSESSEGRRSHTNVRIFPNPVRPGYDGQVGITGLVGNVEVKITDVNGKLVRALQANGGTASWDLLDYNGRRISSGIYVVFSSTGDGEDTFIGKIAVIN